MKIPNKRGRIPPAKALHAQSRKKVEIFYSEEGLSIGVAPGEDETQWIASMKSNRHVTLYVPTPDAPPADRETARFIGKVALEGLAARCM
jgi:hypothetical protein